ncbi:hypothetical protein C0J52_14358 [Blattella germanica]|nr:hypothetical protein C0J52_14358 [Blattella germanica]
MSNKELQIGHRPANAVKDDKVPLVAWEPYFCVLLQDEQTLTAYRSEELSYIRIVHGIVYVFPACKLPTSFRIRLDGGAKAFRQRWGYELSPPPPLLEEEEGEGDGEPAETASLREESTVHTVSPLGTWLGTRRHVIDLLCNFTPQRTNSYCRGNERSSLQYDNTSLFHSAFHTPTTLTYGKNTRTIHEKNCESSMLLSMFYGSFCSDSPK